MVLIIIKDNDFSKRNNATNYKPNIHKEKISLTPKLLSISNPFKIKNNNSNNNNNIINNNNNIINNNINNNNESNVYYDGDDDVDDHKNLPDYPDLWSLALSGARFVGNYESVIFNDEFVDLSSLNGNNNNNINNIDFGSNINDINLDNNHYINSYYNNNFTIPYDKDCNMAFCLNGGKVVGHFVGSGCMCNCLATNYHGNRCHLGL
ncbi:hypothetical protein HELRODRAFT_161585 [Helobdella robusta]|uniref:Uncharacterized protein n=1 Tax=Helobdella robusta TaxID=6412 RepID=T1ERN5_HELRO|nr:hypothetical protein HELRODRAFT_161585 [Helobdella robusta]ESO02330.1 hypothetical protein HELRODRAFT_161585 [Helobdella robusta]